MFSCLFLFIYLFVFSLIFIVIIWEKNDIFKTTPIFIHLINGTVLGRALWGVNTLPTRNRLPNPYFGLQTMLLFHFYLVFLWFSIINYGGDSNLNLNIFFKIKF